MFGSPGDLIAVEPGDFVKDLTKKIQRNTKITIDTGKFMVYNIDKKREKE